MPVRSHALSLGLAMLLVSPPPAAADLLVEPHTTTVTEAAAGDGIVAPGESVRITQQVQALSPLTGVQGTLSSTASGVTIGSPASGFADAPAGGLTANAAPFVAALPASATCGTALPFALDLAADQGRQALGLEVRTGAEGAARQHDATGLPLAIPDEDDVTSALTATGSGLVREIDVRVAALRHPELRRLRLTLVAPDGTEVLLMGARGGAVADLEDVTFTSRPGAPSIRTAATPFDGGTYRAEGDLGRLRGRTLAGTWRLRAEDYSGTTVVQSGGAAHVASATAGTLDAWGVTLAPATCGTQPQAVIAATPDPADRGETVTLDASGSVDPNGTIAAYDWDLDGDGAFDDATGATTTTSWAAKGSHTVRLRVTDDSAQTGQATATIVVSTPPAATLTAAPLAPTTGDQVTLSAAGSSDPDGTIARHEWDLDGDGAYEHDTGATATTTTSFATPGAHTVGVRVTDDSGRTATATRVVNAGNRAPSAALVVPVPALAGSTVTLSAAGSRDPDGMVVLYEWDLDGDGAFERSTGPSPRIDHAFAHGTFDLNVRVTDDVGVTAVATRALRVTRAPEVALTASAATAGAPVTFTATAADPDGPVARYEWDLDGDGTFELSTGAEPSAGRTYPAAGTVLARVRVTDADGATATSTLLVAVASAPAPPDSPNAPAAPPAPAPAAPGRQPQAPAPGAGAFGLGLPFGEEPPAFRASLLGSPRQRLRTALQAGVTLTCEADRRATCRATVEVSARDARRLRLKGARKLGTATASTIDGASTRLVLRLTAAARRALKRSGGVRVLVRAHVRDEYGQTVEVTRAVQLRR